MPTHGRREAAHNKLMGSLFLVPSRDWRVGHSHINLSVGKPTSHSYVNLLTGATSAHLTRSRVSRYILCLGHNEYLVVPIHTKGEICICYS
jgi:hypothetical protein